MGIDDLKVALRRARFGIVSVAIASVIATALGVAMVHAGNATALRYRDRIIAERDSASQIIALYRERRPVSAAALDAAGNLGVSTIALLAGYWTPAAYALAIYRGWMLGTVSVDENHVSRLSARSEASYYLLVLILQQLPYVLVAGAGVNIGMARRRPVGDYVGPKILRVPRDAWLDAGRICVLALPLFALASIIEFLPPPAPR